MDELMPEHSPYPPIGDYALLSDCQSVALLSRSGSIDWCCLPRIDHGSVFGRLLDWEKGGFCSISPEKGDAAVFRRYIGDTLVLEYRSFRASITVRCGPGSATMGDASTASRAGTTRS
jgi:GH15 family glucan-1,4-alpha-glucosidase